jgi:glycosyltransferase involved in cell wall biosynthesis
VFLNFGIIRDYKRVDTLINAAIIAKEKTNIPFKIRIAGRCDNWTHYQRMIKFPEIFELKIGQVPNNEVPELFNTSHYFVLPYQDIAQSGALTVALNYNLPIIASRLPSFEEFIEDGKTGFLIKPASIEDLSEKIIFILHNHDKIYPELRISLKKFVDDNLKKETIAERYVDFFKDI